MYSTPWGASQNVTKIRRGVISVMTAGHGGIGVSKALAEKTMPYEALHQNFGYCQSGYYWFEEDCLYCVPFYYNPEWFIDWMHAIGKIHIDSIATGEGKELYEKYILRTMNNFYKHLMKPADV